MAVDLLPVDDALTGVRTPSLQDSSNRLLWLRSFCSKNRVNNHERWELPRLTSSAWNGMDGVSWYLFLNRRALVKENPFFAIRGSSPRLAELERGDYILR